jgi:hypothetical protein
MTARKFSLLIVMAAAWNTAFADSFYCGTHIIDEDIAKAEVLEKCGQPTRETSDTFYYDRGTDEFGVTLHFNAEDRVNRIEEDAD